jgi:hypothetical protein
VTRILLPFLLSRSTPNWGVDEVGVVARQTHVQRICPRSRQHPTVSSRASRRCAGVPQYQHRESVLRMARVSRGRETNTLWVECAADAMDALCRCHPPYQNLGRVYCSPIHGCVVENGSHVEREGMTDIEGVGGQSGRARSTGGEALLPASSFLRDIEYAHVERTSEALLAARPRWQAQRGLDLL